MEEQKPVKKNKSMQKGGIICFLLAFGIFFVMTFIKVVLDIMSRGSGGQEVTTAGQSIFSLIQWGIPIILIMAAVVLLIVSAITEK